MKAEFSSQTVRICLSLGRHETTSSGFWVYARELLFGLQAVVAEVESEEGVGFSFTVRYQAEERFTRELAGLDSHFLLEPIDPRNRRLSDALSLLGSTDPFDIFHGTSNQVPPRGDAKKVVTMHDLIQPYPPREARSFYTLVRALYYRSLFRGVFRWSDLVVTGHPKSKDEISERYPYARRVEVIPPCLSREFLESVPLAEVDRKYILCFSSRDPRKNLDGALRAYAELDSGTAPPLVLLVSTDQVREHYVQVANKLGISERTEYRVGVSPLELPKLYREAICALFPSFAEGFGYPIYEALSQGTPVVTSKGILLPEFSSLSGTFVQEVDPRSRDSIIKGLRDQLSLSFTLAERNRVRGAIQERLRFTSYARTLLSLYLELLKPHFS